MSSSNNRTFTVNAGQTCRIRIYRSGTGTYSAAFTLNKQAGSGPYYGDASCGENLSTNQNAPTQLICENGYTITLNSQRFNTEQSYYYYLMNYLFS